jgi:hypothetical protein
MGDMRLRASSVLRLAVARFACVRFARVRFACVRFAKFCAPPFREEARPEG